MKKIIFIAAIVLLVTASIIPNYINKIPVENIKQPVTAEKRGEGILTVLKNNDMIIFSGYVHPEKGVRLSPYTNVKESDMVFDQEGIKTAPMLSTSFIWGNYDGSGEPIELSFFQYLEKFVYDHDYLNAVQKSVNEPIGSGNMINNVAEFYPGATVLEYHFSGFDPQYEGMDWTSLKLVMEKYNDEWYLVGVVHDGWSI